MGVTTPVAGQCFYCGKTNRIGNTTLRDGSTLCSKCFGLIPRDIRDVARIEWSSDDYMRFASYINNEEQDNRARFTPTIKTRGFACDNTSRLFRLTDKTVYPADGIISYNLGYKPTSIDKSVFKTKTTGVLSLTLSTTLPALNNYTVVLGEKMTADGYYNGSGEFVYGFPEIAIRLHKELGELCRAKRPRQMYRRKPDVQSSGYTKDQDRPNNNSAEPDSKLIKAMNLFMIDDLTQVTESDLHSQRNRLIKTFHPDGNIESDVYAQKINEAYEILKTKINRR